MTAFPFTAADLETLKQWDTPTICNGLELVVPERRAIGFTVEPMVAVDRKLPADRRPRPHRPDPRQGAAVAVRSRRARTGTTMSPPATCRPSP